MPVLNLCTAVDGSMAPGLVKIDVAPIACAAGLLGEPKKF